MSVEHLRPVKAELRRAKKIPTCPSVMPAELTR